MTKDNATPRPWSINYKIGDAIICIGEPETNGTDYYGGKLICESVEPSNAQLIVKAVNEYDTLKERIDRRTIEIARQQAIIDELVEALKMAIATIGDMPIQASGIIPTIEKIKFIKNALSKQESNPIK